MVETLTELFEESLNDLYNAEKQFLTGMSKISLSVSSPALKSVTDAHITQTRAHVERLAKPAEMVGVRPDRKTCKAARGLVEEAEEVLRAIVPGPVLDAAIIESAEKIEHYEICCYRTLIDWAGQLDRIHVLPLLEKRSRRRKTPTTP